MKPIAICQNKRVFDHYTSWIPRLIEYCEENKIPYEIVDCYSNGFIDSIDSYSALVWYYSNYVISDLLEAWNILKVAETKGLVTFPATNSNWHFDDKIAEMYALKSVDAIIPNSWVFYLKDDCINWLKKEAKYPLIGKLRAGSGSNNVKKFNNASQAIAYANRMFSKGYDPSPSFAYKAISKFQSSKNVKMMISRIKKIPQFLNTRRHAKMMPIEKGYCYFQEFVPNDGYDLKVVVIGDKMTFCARKVRNNDFRASGGGDIYYDRRLLTERIIDSAFSTAKKLQMNCVGFDYVIDKSTGECKIIEMCYGFDYVAQKDLCAYVDATHIWHEEPVCVPDEVIKMVVSKIKTE